MSELEFDWDELPELSDISLVSYAPLQALLKCIIAKINDHARYMKQKDKEEREKKELLTSEEKEILEENKHIPNEQTPIESTLSYSSREEEFEKEIDRNEDENSEKDEEVNVKEKNKQITEENDIDTVGFGHQKLEKTDPENDEKRSNLSDLLQTIQQGRESSNENQHLNKIEKLEFKKPKDSENEADLHDEMKKILQSIQDLDSKLSKLSGEMNEKDSQYINLHKQVQDMKTILRKSESEAEKPQTPSEEKQEEKHQEEKKESEEHNGTSSTEKLVVPHSDCDITEPITNSFERRIKQLEEEIASLKNHNQDMSHSLSKHQIDLNSKTLEMENHKRCIDELKKMSEIPREMREATNNDPAMNNAKVSKETQVRSLTHSPERSFENLSSQPTHNNENILHMSIESPTTSGVHPHVSTHLTIQSAPKVLNEPSKRVSQEDTDSDDMNIKYLSKNQESSCFNTNNVSNSGSRNPSVTIFNDDMIGQSTESKRTPQEVGTPLNPKVGEVSDEMLKEEVVKLENRLEEKLNSLNTMLQALDEKLIRKFKDIVTYVDNIKDQLYNKLRCDIDQVMKSTSDKLEENTSTVPSIDKRTSLRSSFSQVDLPKKKTDESLFRKSRSRRSDSFKDSPLDSPKAAWIKNEDERSQTPPDSSLETRLLLKLNSKAEQDLMNIIQQKIDEIFEKLDQLDDDMQGKANSETVVNHDQLKELESKVRRKADREEVSSLIERMTQESMTNSNPDGMFALGDNIEKSQGGQITLEGDDIIRLKEAINKQASTIQQMSKQKADKLELVKQIGEKTEQIEKLERTKADANIVARKADREYVDNMLERLRKELIHSIEHLNNSTADLFAKDMNLLQNLLEEKASRQDLRKIREVLSSSQKEDTSGEGLAGKKAYRCLSCNRSIAGMRIKPLSMNFTSFVNHLPNPKSRMYPKKAYLNDSLSQTRTLSKDYSDETQHFEQESEDISCSPIHPSSREEKSSSGKQYREELDDGKLPSIV